jgi:hypothetical protein
VNDSRNNNSNGNENKDISRITIRIIKGGRIKTGIICIRKMGITMRITIGFKITISITIRIKISKRA